MSNRLDFTVGATFELWNIGRSWKVCLFDQYCVCFLSLQQLLSCWYGIGLNDLLIKLFRPHWGLNHDPWCFLRRGFGEWNRWEGITGIFWSIPSHKLGLWLFSVENCPRLNVCVFVFVCVCEWKREIRPCVFICMLMHKWPNTSITNWQHQYWQAVRDKSSRIPPHPLVQWMRH